jgi:hypothetical protein
MEPTARKAMTSLNLTLLHHSLRRRLRPLRWKWSACGGRGATSRVSTRTNTHTHTHTHTSLERLGHL